MFSKFHQRPTKWLLEHVFLTYILLKKFIFMTKKPKGSALETTAALEKAIAKTKMFISVSTLFNLFTEV